MTSDEFGVATVEMASEEEEALLEQAQQARREQEEMLETLAHSITAKFQQRASRRQVKESEWLEAHRLYLGKLSVLDKGTSSDRPFEKKKTRSRPDINIVRAKVNIAVAQTISQQFGVSEKNWDLFPPPDTAVPEVAMACSGMSDAIEKQLGKCHYPRKARLALTDRVVLGTGILKGPVNSGLPKRRFRQIEGSQLWEPYVTQDYYPSVEVVNPWFFYPDETTNEPDKLEDAIEVHPMSAFELKRYMNHPSFIPTSIEEVLKEKPDEYINTNYTEFATLTESNPYLFKDKYLVLEYHGPITRTQLEQLAIEPTYESLNDEYYGEVWVCQGRVIRIELENIEASFCIPYLISVWHKDPSSVFGFGVPITMKDQQRVVNQAWHMILDNSSVSSGPQVAMQKNYIEPADGEWELDPFKVWYLTDPQVSVDQAIQFFFPPNVTQNIMPVLEMARNFAEEESCIPLITAGLASPQNTETATGQLATHQFSTTLLDFMGEDWDDYVTRPLIERMYAWNMQYNPDPTIKGDFEVDVRTSSEFKNKQLHIRDLERLSVEASQNPETAKWVNMGELQRARLHMMNLPSKTIIRTPEEVAAIEAEQAQQPDMDALEAQREQAKLELENRRLQLEEAKLMFEMNQAQQREMWDHEEKMSANFARTVEAEARVITAQTEKEIQMLKLAQNNEQFYAKLMSQEKIEAMSTELQAFFKGMEDSRKERELMLKSEELGLYKAELDYAQKRGKGI